MAFSKSAQSLWIKRALSRRLTDIDIQNWTSDVNNNSFCTIYRYFKHTLVLETYLLDLDNSSRFILTKFRCRNIKLPNNLYRFSVDDEDRVCNLC